MKRKKKRFAWPRKLYDKDRIGSENKLVKKYGLKNKREVWKSEAKVNYFRGRAKKLITAGQEEQQNFFDKLNRLGFGVTVIADVLGMEVEDILKRRITSVLVSKGIAPTTKTARQMVVHKRILVGKKMVGSPSYLVGVDEENQIQIKKKVKKAIVIGSEDGGKTNEKKDAEDVKKSEDMKKDDGKSDEVLEGDSKKTAEVKNE